MNPTISQRNTAIEAIVVTGGITRAVGTVLGVLQGWAFAVVLGFTLSLGYVLGYRPPVAILLKGKYCSQSKTKKTAYTGGEGESQPGAPLPNSAVSVLLRKCAEGFRRDAY